MSNPGDRVRFNVGGKIFETSSTTLAVAGRNSMLGALLDDHWNLPSSSSSAVSAVPEYFIDRNPAAFSVLLDLLRTGQLHKPPTLSDRFLLHEASFYGLLPHVKASMWGPLDGNRLRHSRSVSGTAPGDGVAIRASPDGGCCVSHGSIVHVYDWSMEQRAPLMLEYQQVNDAGYLDGSGSMVVITARERPGRADCGMALFSSDSGELRHRFSVSHDGAVKSFTAGALTFGDNMIFAGCKGRCNEHGVGIWDTVTGKQTDFFYELPGCPLGEADKLQWMNSRSSLMVSTFFPRADDSYIGLLDFREKNIVWQWSDFGNKDDKRVLHAIAMEDNYSICVVNQYDDLGFIDLRSSAGAGVRWSSRSKLMKGRAQDGELCYPKLAVHNGQLFCSMNDSISVFCGPEWVLTATLRKSYGGAICDFSIGGDRLLALHSEENVFDIWETPPAPVL